VGGKPPKAAAGREEAHPGATLKQSLRVQEERVPVRTLNLSVGTRLACVGVISCPKP